MLKRLALRLVRSAAGRDLAVALVDRHGLAALALIDRRIADGCGDAAVLALARREIVRLMPLLTPAPQAVSRPDGHHMETAG